MTAINTALLTFDFPLAWQAGLPAIAGALFYSAKRLSRRGVAAGRIAAVLGLRALLLLAAMLLVAKPVRVANSQAVPSGKTVVLLLDRSESMVLDHQQSTRFAAATAFAREKLLPAIRRLGLIARTLAFAEGTQSEPEAISSAKPDGKRTNLAGAISRAMAEAPPPLAVVALTDGIANDATENSRAIAALVDTRAPFLGIGFGSDSGVQTVTLRGVEAPHTVIAKSAFFIAARLEAMGFAAGAQGELLLFREGKLMQRKPVSFAAGSHTWQESFRVSEDPIGAVKYRVQLMPPPTPGLKALATDATVGIQVTDHVGLRVLYVQGALTWDYKFVSLALRGDPGLKITGLTRTSSHSVFRQNVESTSELLSGFPSSLEELAPFRVVVLSNLRPADLAPAQQELLSKFCAVMGGGVLMIGGPETFDASWQGSRLEQLLPVVFSPNRGVSGLERQFHLELSEEALRHATFQISDDSNPRETWAKLPPFLRYGVVDAPKPGAQVWATHNQDEGPRGRRVLVASQRFGAGQSAVIAVQNFWRWRLAKDADTRQFDRFWRQLFRFLADANRREVNVHLSDQELRPQTDIKLTVERQPSPSAAKGDSNRYTIRVTDSAKILISEQSLTLIPRRPVDLSFRAETSGIYTVQVLDHAKIPVTERGVEIRDVNVEFEVTARNMESLRQWASLSGGEARKAEDCDDADAMVSRLIKKAGATLDKRPLREPLGMNGWVLSALLTALGMEYGLKKKWGLA